MLLFTLTTVNSAWSKTVLRVRVKNNSFVVLAQKKDEKTEGGTSASRRLDSNFERTFSTNSNQSKASQRGEGIRYRLGHEMDFFFASSSTYWKEKQARRQILIINGVLLAT